MDEMVCNCSYNYTINTDTRLLNSRGRIRRMNHTSGSCPAARRNKRTPGTVRVLMVFLALFAQLLLLAYLVDLLSQNAVYLYFLLEIAGAMVVAFIVTKDRNSS